MPLTAGIIIQLMIGPWVSTSIYDIGTIDFTMQAVLTNTAPTGAYRGAGRPEAIYIIERLMDAAARQLKLDPAEIRRRNLIKPEQMPYKNAMGQTYDSGKFGSILEQGLALAKWSGFDARAAQSRARGKWRGRGLAAFLEWTGGNVFEERVTVAVLGSGEIEVYAATMPMGQGIATSYAQLVVDVFGVPIDKIRIVMGDTDRGSGFGSAGSRSLFTAGSTIQVASEKAVATGKRARRRRARGRRRRSRPTPRATSASPAPTAPSASSSWPSASREQRIFVDVTSKVDGPSWPNGAHICEVEIDPETGAVEIVSYVSANDVGRVVNPMIVRGQLDGGAVQGIGQALMRAHDLRRGVRPGPHRQLHGLRDAARRCHREIRAHPRPVDALPHQSARRQGRGRARHHRRHARRRERRRRRARPATAMPTARTRSRCR